LRKATSKAGVGRGFLPPETAGKGLKMVENTMSPLLDLI